MKIFYSVAALLFLMFLVSCKPSAEKAGAYNDKIVALSVRIQNSENELIEAYKGGDAKLMEPALQKFKAEINACTDSLNNMENFDGKDDFKRATLKMFATYKKVAETEYAEMLSIFKEPDEAYTEERHDRVLQLDSLVNVKEKSAMAELKEFHKKFAADYRIVLKEDGADKK